MTRLSPLTSGALILVLSACSRPALSPAGSSPQPDAEAPSVEQTAVHAYVGVFFDVDVPPPQTYLPRLWFAKDDLDAHCGDDPATATDPWPDVLELEGSTGDLPGFEATTPASIPFSHGAVSGQPVPLSGNVDIQALSIVDAPTTYSGRYPQFTSTQATFTGSITLDAAAEAVLASSHWSPSGAFEALRCPLLDRHSFE